MVGVILSIILLFLCVTPAEGIMPLEKEEVVKKKTQVTQDEYERSAEYIDERAIETEILESIKEFEREKEEIIKEQRLRPEIEAPIFKPYIAPISVSNTMAPVSKKEVVQMSKSFPKKKNIWYDVIFFSVILALFFGIKTLLKPSKSK